MSLIAILLFVFLGACLAPLSKHLSSKVLPWLLGVPAIAAFGILSLSALPIVTGGGNVSYFAEWVPYLGINFSLNLTGMGLLLALLVTGIGSLILIYAAGYMKGHDQAHLLFTYIYAFMFAMVGLAFSDHLLLIFVFWELTSIISYLLIGFNHTQETARKNALQALLVTGLGGMALLAGLILLANATGTWSLAEIISKANGGLDLASHPFYPAILTLVLMGAFTKSAQFPFHFWLPNAMAAPTPVSAYLHSATMVKAGVFLLSILSPVLAGTTAWTVTLCTAGGLTLLLGGIFGLRQTDLKKILAGTTLAVLGLITLLLGVGGHYGTLSAILVLLGHSFYKATLFMVAGSVDHETGTRSTHLLGGLRTAMPWTAGAACLAGLSKMGLPPFYGFLGKEYAFKAGLKTDMPWLINALILIGGAMLLALAVKTAIIPFWKKKSFSDLPKYPHEAPISMRIGPVILATLGVVVGIFPGLMAPLVSAANSSILGHRVDPEVKLWAGFNLPLLLSFVTVALGVIIYLSSSRIRSILEKSKIPSADEVYQVILASVIRFANWQTKCLQSGYLRNYIHIILISTTCLVVMKLISAGGIPNIESELPISISIIVMSLLMLVSIWLAITTLSRLVALIALGVVGFGVAMIYAFYSAPDLAITQILVETLTVVLFAWVIYKLPDFKNRSSKLTRLFDAAVSLSVGTVITIMVLRSEAIELGAPISDKLAAMSYPDAHGANVVNVILVDFRALDTWGEVTVLAIAALGTSALVRALIKQKPSK
ncbi:MAG: hydrogen gas-evolving membrane-bound hydrogenase subunit E [Akkermansiaceae bacterium]